MCAAMVHTHTIDNRPLIHLVRGRIAGVQPNSNPVGKGNQWVSYDCIRGEGILGCLEQGGKRDVCSVLTSHGMMIIEE